MSELRDEALNELEEITFGGFIAILGLLVKRVILVLSASIITGSVGVSMYGVYELARRYGSISIRLSTGFNISIDKFYPTVETGKQKADILGTSLTISLILGVLSAVILWFAAPLIVGFSSQETVFSSLLRIAAITIIPSIMVSTTVTYFRAEEKPLEITLLKRLAVPFAKLCSAVVGAMVLSSVLGVAIIYMSTMVFLGGVGWHLMNSGTSAKIRYDADLEKLNSKLESFGDRVMVSRIASILIYSGTFLIGTFLLDSTEMGIFSLGMLLTGLARWPLRAVNDLIMPVVARLKSENDPNVLKKVYQSSSRIILSITLFIVSVFIFENTFVKVIEPKLAEYGYMFVILGFSRIFETGAGSCGNILKMTDHASTHMKINIVLAGINIPLTILMSYWFGLTGLAASFTFSMISNNMLQVAALKRYENLQPFTKDHLRPLTAFIVVSVFYNYTETSSTLHSIFTIVAGLGIYLIAIKFIGVNDLDRNLLQKIWRDLRNRLKKGL